MGKRLSKEDVHLYWITTYNGGYRSTVMHGTVNEEVTLCGRKIDMYWDGGYETAKDSVLECKLCNKKL